MVVVKSTVSISAAADGQKSIGRGRGRKRWLEQVVAIKNELSRAYFIYINILKNLIVKHRDRDKGEERVHTLSLSLSLLYIYINRHFERERVRRKPKTRSTVEFGTRRKMFQICSRTTSRRSRTRSIMYVFVVSAMTAMVSRSVVLCSATTITSLTNRRALLTTGTTAKTTAKEQKEDERLEKEFTKEAKMLKITKEEVEKNYEVNHPRPFSWQEKQPDTSKFDQHVAKVARENFEKATSRASEPLETVWPDDNIVDDPGEESMMGDDPPSLLDAFKNKKIPVAPKVETLSEVEDSPFAEVLILAPSAFMLIGLMYMWRCKYAWKENFQESQALSELNKVRESKEYALFSAYISSGNFDIGMLYWALGGITLLLQMKYNAVYALVPAMTSLAVGVFYSMIFQRSLTGIPGVTGPPLAQRLLILVVSIILLANLIWCEVKGIFVATNEYWGVLAGQILIPQMLAFYHRMGGWIQHNREYRYKMVE